ncbi:MAG: ribonuclease domain-containing protein [Burkholderiaceae bacterium]
MAVVACACSIAPIAPLLGAAEARRIEDGSGRGVEASQLASMRVSQLPPQGREVLAAIRTGGPFAFPRDGIVFGNREHILPQRPRGYYAEYTVPTPGERTRGARRIIAARGETGDVRNSGEYYYTDDHYQSFRRIVQ